MRKILSVSGIIILMLVLIIGTVAAEGGDDPTTPPAPMPTTHPVGSTFYMHPVVQILGAYFGRTTRPMLPTPTPTQTSTVDPLATPTEVSSDTPTETPTATPVMGPEEFAEQIALYHEQGIGFGVLVKLYAMVEDSVQACADQQSGGGAVDPSQPTCEAVTVEQLVSEFQSGTGMGQLFKEYGKPALLGVGHVRKSLQNQPEEVQSTPTPALSVDSNDLQSQDQKLNNGKNNGDNGNKPEKVKPPKPPKSQGPKK